MIPNASWRNFSQQEAGLIHRALRELRGPVKLQGGVVYFPTENVSRIELSVNGVFNSLLIDGNWEAVPTTTFNQTLIEFANGLVDILLIEGVNDTGGQS